ncbi:ribose-phosphate diphosphokinase [Thermomicrobium roseum]|jgi:ribose-phosphate pyrophosphokinase|uniref:Ribose-phosphate pyrophosphokinase n=1 Tax=Thermomicrobium roseum (strain ATCC 27502 / DSM 5159 / P-2) TaxID=309801 RepID=B9L2H3_THERP|nr:ribose-phosphate pyrophosphokinase [Thermomicrobium roseum]ACM05391.1 ribose-phosphate pyrophosphokinase [Thermomicrobium roseum DSM 5159]MBO9386107.1 ribose-phosphate pyrophosphokinase [Thermomicrobium sp.]
MGGLYDQLTIFGGNSNPELTKAICAYIDIPPGRIEVFKFSNENIFVRIGESVRENDVFVIQSFSSPVNESIMELLIIIDALKRASAGRITAVIPYYAYGRTDKKDQPRVPITARLIADMITVAGADRILTVDLHAGQIQGFFNIPVDEMTALPILARYFQEKRLENPVVVSPDLGSTKRARNFAEELDAPLAIIEKRRLGNDDRTEVLNLIGSVDDASVILIDDEIDTAGSITQAAELCIARGAREVYAACTHPVLSGPAIERLALSPIKEVVVTDTIPLPPQKRLDKITVLSVAPLLGESIQRIHTGASVSLAYRSAGRLPLR